MECFYKKPIKKYTFRRNNEVIKRDYFSCGYINEYLGRNGSFEFNLCEDCTLENIKKVIMKVLTSTLSDTSVDLLDSCIKIQELEGKEKVKQELLNLARKGYSGKNIRMIVQKLELDK